MGMARFLRTMALAAAIGLLAPRLTAFDAPPRWLACDSPCPWSQVVNGLCGRIVCADLEQGQVFFELRNVLDRPLSVPWCVYCRDAGWLRPRAPLQLPSGEQGRRCVGAQLLTLRIWDGAGYWRDASWPPADPGLAPVGYDGIDGADYDLLSRCVLAPGERCLGVVASSPVLPGTQCALTLTLHQDATTPEAWSGSLEMGPNPWFFPAHAPPSRSTEDVPEHVAPLRFAPVPDGYQAGVVRDQYRFNRYVQLNDDLRAAIDSFRRGSAADYYMGRVLTAQNQAERCYLLEQAAALQVSDEALGKLTNALRPVSDVAVADALQALDELCGAITFPAWAVARIDAAAQSQAYVLTPGGMEGPTMAGMVEESALCTRMAYDHQPAYRPVLRRAVTQQHALPAALLLAIYHDQSGSDLILAALRDLVAHLQPQSDTNPRQEQEFDQQFYGLNSAAWSLHLRAAVPLLLAVRQQRWCNGQVERALAEIGDPAAIPGLQALRSAVAAGTDCSETLTPDAVSTRVLELDLAIATLQPDSAAALKALQGSAGSQPLAQARILRQRHGEQGRLTPAELAQAFKASSSNAVCKWVVIALSTIRTRACTQALIDCLASPNANRQFPDQVQGADPRNVATMLAMVLRDQTGCSLGTDPGPWQAWWQEVGSHLLGP